MQNKLLTLHILRNREINIVLFSSNLSNLLEGLLTPADASAAAGAAMTKADLASLLHPLKTGHSRRHKRTNTQLNKDTSDMGMIFANLCTNSCPKKCVIRSK